MVTSGAHLVEPGSKWPATRISGEPSYLFILTVFLLPIPYLNISKGPYPICGICGLDGVLLWNQEGACVLW